MSRTGESFMKLEFNVESRRKIKVVRLGCVSSKLDPPG